MSGTTRTKAIQSLAERIRQCIGSDEAWLTELDNESFKRLISINKGMF